MRSSKPTEAELEALRFVAERPPVTAREVADHLAGRRGLARTTVLTLLERLRKKGLVLREGTDGSFAYRPAQAKSALLQGIVDDFVQRALGGSLSPLVAYLSGRQDATPEEIAELRRLVGTLEKGREDDGRP